MSKSDTNTSALLSAIDDIRHALVEEPWFGKEVTGSIEPAEQSFESFYGAETEQKPDNSPEQDINLEQELNEDLEQEI